jgi:hypothetical protein
VARQRAGVVAAPQLCNPGATLIWTRHTRAPDLTPRIRAWFTGAGFAERAFTAVPAQRIRYGNACAVMMSLERLRGVPSS